MKQVVRVLVSTLLTVVFSLCVSAQTLVFHLAGGAKSTVSLPATFTVTPTGDKLVVDGGGSVVELAKDDVMCVTYRGKTGDVNEDATVDVADIATIVDIMAGKGGDTEPEPPEEKAYTSCPDTNHPHMIDLGLPSGTKWACCNVGAMGASAPEGYGDYYAWGETSPKSVYKWDTYQYGYYNDDGDYSHLLNIGTDIAGTSYDAATANWGSPWHMPTKAQCDELCNNCYSTWTTQNGVNGRKFTGPNGGTIFLPAAGYRWNSGLYNWGYGDYWSSTLDESYPDDAYILGFSSSGVSTGSGSRNYGESVRPVR